MNPEGKEYGIGWLKFYVNWRFPLGIIFGALSLLSEFGQAAENGFLNDALFLLAAGFDVFMYIYRIIVYINMQKMTEKSYTMNMILLVLETLLIGVYRAVMNYGTNPGIWLVITIVIATLIWFVPNYIYFSHRRYLFNGMHTLKEISDIYKVQSGKAVAAPADTVRDGKKFYCKNCGTYSTGWYQVCPTCGASGQMVKAQEIPTDRIQTPLTPPAPVENEVKCGNCGAALVPGAAFCRECGTPVSVEDSTKEKAPLILDTVLENKIVCSFCGNVLFEGQRFCNKCGNPVVPVEQEPVVQVPAAINEAVAEKEIVLSSPDTLDLSALPAALRRAYIFIEDEEWDRAQDYLEKVLDGEPENAYAYLGKAMAAVKVGTPTRPTGSEMRALMSRKEYVRAKRFADGALAGILAVWETAAQELEGI